MNRNWNVEFSHEAGRSRPCVCREPELQFDADCPRHGAIAEGGNRRHPSGRDPQGELPNRAGLVASGG